MQHFISILTCMWIWGSLAAFPLLTGSCTVQYTIVKYSVLYVQYSTMYNVATFSVCIVQVLDHPIKNLKTLNMLYVQQKRLCSEQTFTKNKIYFTQPIFSSVTKSMSGCELVTNISVFNEFLEPFPSKLSEFLSMRLWIKSLDQSSSAAFIGRRKTSV